jgi:hypothetical protein
VTVFVIFLFTNVSPKTVVSPKCKNMKASLVFYPNLGKKNAINGLIPIYLRICFRRNKVENRLNVTVHQKDLDRWDPVMQRITERNSPINIYLGGIEKKFNDFLILHPTDLLSYSPNDIRNFVLGISQEKEKPLLKDFVNDFFKQTILNNVNCTPGTIKNYRKAINHLILKLDGYIK